MIRLIAQRVALIVVTVLILVLSGWACGPDPMPAPPVSPTTTTYDVVCQALDCPEVP